MMTYYAIFALFPMALFVVSLALLLVPDHAIRQAVDMAVRTMPGQVAEMVRSQVARMEAASAGGLALGGLLLALWGASRGAVSLGRALNDIYDLPETRPWWKIQITAVATTLGVAVLLLLAVALLALGPTIGHIAAKRFALGAAFDTAWALGRWPGAGLLVMLVWAILYRALPNTKQPFRVLTPGAFAAVVIWLGTTFLFGLYVGRFGQYERTYGSLGAVILFLMWLWLSNASILLGAEINNSLRRGSST